MITERLVRLSFSEASPRRPPASKRKKDGLYHELRPGFRGKQGRFRFRPGILRHRRHGRVLQIRNRRHRLAMPHGNPAAVPNRPETAPEQEPKETGLPVHHSGGSIPPPGSLPVFGRDGRECSEAAHEEETEAALPGKLRRCPCRTPQAGNSEKPEDLRVKENPGFQKTGQASRDELRPYRPEINYPIYGTDYRCRSVRRCEINYLIYRTDYNCCCYSDQE